VKWFPQRRNGPRRARQSGYAYFMVFFMITVMIIASQAVLRNMVVEGQREHEKEMIWRGNQYVRALRLFYRKTGHYPQTMDDLETGLPDLHFIRPECLKDPMNRVDGSWRLIYTNASGQIIGSVRYATMQQMALMDLNGGKIPVPDQSASGTPSADQSGTSTPDTGASPNPPSAAGPGSPAETQPPASGQGLQNQQPPQTGPGSSSGASTAAGPSAPGAGPLSGLSPSTLAAIAQLKPTGPVDGPVLGGFLAGVGGGNHYDGDSVKFYKGGKKYQQWEFIWNPLEDQARAMQNGLNSLQSQPGAPGQLPGQPGLPIANPNGGAPTAPANPSSGAPQPAPDQPQPAPTPQP
jgi:hypothetical protein